MNTRHINTLVRTKYTIVLPESKVSGEKVMTDLERYVEREVILGVRPECVHDEENIVNLAKTGVIDCNVEITEMMGAETFLYLECEGIPITARVSPRTTAHPGDQIKVSLDPNRIHLFDKETEKTIVN